MKFYCCMLSVLFMIVAGVTLWHGYFDEAKWFVVLGLQMVTLEQIQELKEKK